ncbi:hypothetical protein ACWCPY_43330, partial [Streptomyces sp. NPDC002403]
LLFGDERRERLGVRVDALGRHGITHLPAIEDIARTIRQLAAQQKRVGAHLDTLAARLGLEEGVIRGVLAANGISVKKLGLRFDGKRLNRLGVRVEDLGQHGLAGDGAQELSPDASAEPGRTAPQETTDPDSPNRTHHPASLPPAAGDLARTPRKQAVNHQGGVHPTDSAPYPDGPAENTPGATAPTPSAPLPAPGANAAGTTSERVFAVLNPTGPAAAQDSNADLPPAPTAGNDQPGTPTGKRKRDTRKRDTRESRATDQNPSKRRRRGIPLPDPRDTPGLGPSLDTGLPVLVTGSAGSQQTAVQGADRQGPGRQDPQTLLSAPVQQNGSAPVQPAEHQAGAPTHGTHVPGVPAPGTHVTGGESFVRAVPVVLSTDPVLPGLPGPGGGAGV